jgi:hypothetical protein
MRIRESRLQSTCTQNSISTTQHLGIGIPKKRGPAVGRRAAGLGGGRLLPWVGETLAVEPHEQPVVEPQVSHFRQVPLRTRVKLAQLGQGSPS